MIYLTAKKLRGRIKMKRLRRRIVPLIIIAAFITASFGIIYLDAYSERVNKELAANIIRLHVLANSDSDEDQALKLKVRDRVIRYMEDKLKKSKDINESRQILLENLGNIKKLVLDEIEKNGYDYDARVTFGNYAFPTRKYGDLSLPAGMYDALRITIGKGEGQNWWCVLFPPLCFVDVTHGEMSASAREKLKNSLDGEEYNIVVSADSEEDIPIVIKFKIVELFQDSKIKIAGLVKQNN